MREPKKWLEISLRKRWRRRILVVAQYVLVLLLFFLLGARVGVPPYSRSRALLYLILFLLLPLYRTRTSGRTMDEREFALRDAAHVWAYNVLFVSLSIGVAAYFFLAVTCVEFSRRFSPRLACSLCR
jgi:hypothetical protein